MKADVNEPANWSDVCFPLACAKGVTHYLIFSLAHWMCQSNECWLGPIKKKIIQKRMSIREWDIWKNWFPNSLTFKDQRCKCDNDVPKQIMSHLSDRMNESNESINRSMLLVSAVSTKWIPQKIPPKLSGPFRVCHRTHILFSFSLRTVLVTFIVNTSTYF